MSSENTIKVLHGKLIELLERAINTRDPSRGSLTQIPVGLFQLMSLYGGVDDLPSFRKIIEVDLSHIAQLILEKDDFDLFRSLVHGVSTALVLEPTQDIQSQMTQMILEWRGLGFFAEVQDRVDSLKFDLEFETGIEFDIIPHLPEKVRKILGPPSNPSSEENLMKSARALYLNSILLSVFFMTGVQIAFRSHLGQKDAITYLDELWHHTRPSDADAQFTNITPVPTNSLWLTQFYLFGGSRNDLWFDSFQFRDFHGIERYIIEYYLVTLAKLGPPRLIANSEIEALANQGNYAALRSSYFFAKSFLYASSTPKFLSVLELLKDGRYDEFIHRNRSLAIDEKHWLDSLRNIISGARSHLENALKLIETRFPLDQSRVSTCMDKVREAYLQETIIDDVAVPEARTQRNSNLQVLERRLNNVPRECFIEPDSGSVDCTMLWRELGSSVAKQEKSYVMSSFLEGKPHETATEYDTSVVLGKMIELSKRMSEANKNPTCILMPLKVEIDLARTLKLEYRPGPMVKLNEGTVKVRIHREEANSIVLVHRDSCRWIFDPVDGSRLGVWVRSMNKPGRVDVEARSSGKLEFDETGIAILSMPVDGTS